MVKNNAAARKIKAAFNTLKKKTLSNVAEKNFNAKGVDGGKLPHSFVPSIITEMKTLCPWINRDSVNYHYRTWSKRKENDIVQETAMIAIADAISCTNQARCDLRLKGGRPKGSTNESKKVRSDALLAATNEIALEYLEMKEGAGDNCLENGTLKKLIADISRKRNLPDDCVIKCDTIRRRISRHRPFVTQVGTVSPLARIEDAVVDIIIQMARIRQSLSPSKGLKLINDMIDGTELQEELVKWKETHTSNSSGTVGKSIGEIL